jgi:hypothetical protein
VNSCKVVIDTIETLKAMIQMIAIPWDLKVERINLTTRDSNVLHE